MGLVLFAVSYLFALVVAAGIAVFGFGFIESAWGPSNSFQVLVWISLVATFVATISFGLTCALAQRALSNKGCAISGATVAILSIGLFYVHGELAGRASVFATFLAVIVPAVVVAALSPRHGA